jgi:hypothetical protein
MIVITLYEDSDGGLFLHLRGDPTLWRMNERTASTFLTDAMVVANEDTASHPSIFFFPLPWEGNATDDPEQTDSRETTLRAIAVLKLDPAMGDRGAAYTLFRPG